MGNNDDIFDEEDLLAIANDGGDSSSSNGSDEEGDGSPPRVPAKTDDPSLAAENPSASGDGGHDGVKPECPSLPSSEEEPKQPSSAQKPDAAGTEDACASPISSDGDSDDGGFLESWVKEKEANRKANANQEDSGHDDRDEPDQTDGGEEHEGPNSGKTRVELGASVLQWISREESGGKGTADRATGVVGIQQTNDAALSPILLLTTSENSPRKRRRGNGGSAKATIEDLSEESASERRVQSGRIVHASDATRSSNSGNMVDCLARYDSAKRCYVLEMVGMRIDNLQPMGAEAQTNADTGTRAARSKREPRIQSTEWFDPRSIAKRADEQVKQLKRGKGRAEAPKRRKQI